MNFNYGVPGDSVTVSVFDQGGQCANYQSIYSLKCTQTSFCFFLKVNTMYRWFETNLLSLNLDKTHYMQFMVKNNHPDDFDIMHGSKQITMVKIQNSLD